MGQNFKLRFVSENGFNIGILFSVHKMVITNSLHCNLCTRLLLSLLLYFDSETVYIKTILLKNGQCFVRAILPTNHLYRFKVKFNQGITFMIENKFQSFNNNIIDILTVY